MLWFSLGRSTAKTWTLSAIVEHAFSLFATLAKAALEATEQFLLAPFHQHQIVVGQMSGSRCP